jgi:hypothetical protein
MSWRPEVQTAGNGDRWSGNALVFASRAEALDYVEDLMFRWTAVTDTRAVETDEPVTHVWKDGQLGHVKP